MYLDLSSLRVSLGCAEIGRVGPLVTYQTGMDRLFAISALEHSENNVPLQTAGHIADLKSYTLIAWKNKLLNYRAMVS